VLCLAAPDEAARAPRWQPYAGELALPTAHGADPRDDAEWAACASAASVIIGAPELARAFAKPEFAFDPDAAPTRVAGQVFAT
jgi:hypothetical protein